MYKSYIPFWRMNKWLQSLESRECIEFIDFAKGFSVLSVVFYHYLLGLVDNPWSHFISYGGFGVHMFVILSGFGLSLSSYQSVQYFYRKRFSKILIPYYIFVSFVFLLNFRLPVYPNDGFYAWLGHTFFFKMFDERIVTSFGYYLWFISMILQLYLVYPLLIRWYCRFGTYRFLGFVFGVSIAWLLGLSLLNLEATRVLNSAGFAFLWEFGVGIVLGKLFKEKEIIFWNIKNRLILLIGFLMGGILAAILSAKGGSLGFALNMFPAAISFVSLTILTYSLLSSVTVFAKARQGFVSIGQLSYELYLVHGLLVTIAVRYIFLNMSQAVIIGLNFLLVLPVALFIAFLFSKLNSRLYRLFC